MQAIVSQAGYGRMARGMQHSCPRRRAGIASRERKEEPCKGRHLFATVLAGLLFAGPLQAAIIMLQAELNGANEIPSGVGDPDGSGFATFTIDTIACTMIWAVTVENIDFGDRGAHTHRRFSGQSATCASTSRGCSAAGPDRTDADAVLIANPSGFYYNVHTGPFQGGAIRGQLEFVARRRAGQRGPDVARADRRRLAAQAKLIRRRRAPRRGRPGDETRGPARRRPCAPVACPGCSGPPPRHRRPHPLPSSGRT